MRKLLKKEFYNKGPFRKPPSTPRKKSARVRYSIPRRKSSIYRNLPNAEFDSGWYDYIQGLRINTHRFSTKFHECRLVGYPRDVLIRHITYGICINWRRAIKKYMIISNRHPYTKRYARSSFRLVEEEYRHLTWYNNAIHPFSIFNFYYEIIFFFVVMLQLIVLPVLSMFFREHNQILYWIFFPINLMYILTIILNFFTGFYDPNRNLVILNQRDITMHYLKSYFVFDVLALLPQFLRGYLATLVGFDLNVNRNIWLRVLGTLLFLNYYARYFWFMRVLQQLRLFFGMSTYVHTAVELIFNTMMVLVFCTYVSNAIMGMEVWQKFYSVEYNQLAVYNSTDAFMRYRALPVDIRKRIYLFMNFKYQGNFYKESVLKKMFSLPLRREILMTVSEEGMRKVGVFQKCPTEALNKIRTHLMCQIYLPGDTIIREGTEGNCMFFITAGTVAVTGANNKPLCYLRDGAHFGEIALVINIPRVANVVALTPCELFRLEKSHFTRVMKLYPTVLRQIRKDANDRIAKTSESVVDVERLFKTTIRRKRVFYCFND